MPRSRLADEAGSADAVRSPRDAIVFGEPLIGAAEREEVLACLESCWLGTGPRVARFEEAFGRYKRAKHAVAVNSCTASLHLSLLAAEIGPGDEVMTTPLTFCATVNAIIHAGATPVLADVDPETMNIDPKEVRARLTPRTRAIIPVHFAGRPCPMDELMHLAKRHDLVVIEDCAHAIEAEHDGRPVGTIGDFGCFSFYVTKNVVTGEGGMIITDQEDHAGRLKMLALHGMTKDAWKRFGDEGYRHYYVVEAGFKYNMMDLQAAIGIHQLARVEESWRRRRRLWHQYDEALADCPVTRPPQPDAQHRHAHHLYTILIDKDRCGISRDEFLSSMARHHIGVGVHYLSIPEHPVYQEKLGWRPDDFPHAKRIGRQTVSLPLSAKLTASDGEDVMTAVRRILNEPSRRATRRAA